MPFNTVRAHVLWSKVDSIGKSPAPFAGLMLGFGAATLVLARMRR